MAVVAGEHHTLGQHPAIVGCGQAQGLADGRQGIGQESRFRALLGAGPNFLVVKYRQYRNEIPLPGHQKALGARKHAGQVIQPGRGDELSLRAPNGTGLVVVNEQICGQNLFRAAAGLFGNLPAEGALGVGPAVERIQVPGSVIFRIAVDFPIQMNGHIGDQHGVLFQIYQTGPDASALLYQHPSRHTEGPVQPAGVDHSAVALHRQTGIGAIQLRMLTQAKTWRIGMRTRQQEPSWCLGRQPECQQGRAVSDGIIHSALFQLPAALLKADIPLPFQHLRQGLHSVKTVGTLFDKM